jgi:hypothetical protein
LRLIYGDYILDYTEEKVNKINGQAATKRDSRSKKSARKIRNGVQRNNITPEMVEAGARVYEELNWDQKLSDYAQATHSAVAELVSMVYLAMARMSLEGQRHERNPEEIERSPEAM